MRRRNRWTNLFVFALAIASVVTAQERDGGTDTALPVLEPLPELGGTAVLPGAAEDRAASKLLLSDVLRSIHRSYPLVEAARQQALSAEGSSLGARGAFDPQVRAKATRIPLGEYPYSRADVEVVQPTPIRGAELFAGWRYGAGSIPDYYGELRTNDLGELRAGVTLPLWRDGSIDSRRAELQRTRLGETIAEQEVAKALLDAVKEGAQLYWDWVAAGQRVSVVQDLIEIARTRDVAIGRRAERGDVPALDRTENLRILLEREGQLVAAERQLQRTALRLSLFLRNEEGQPLVPARELLPTSFPDPLPLASQQGETTIADALKRRPDLLQLIDKRDQLSITRELAENEGAPLIDVVVGVSQDLGAGSATRARTQLETGVVLELPTLNRVATGKQRAAEAAVARADAQLQLERERAAVEIRDALSAVAAARIRVEVAQREASFARQLVEGEVKRFRLGDTTLLFVNLREQQAAEAQLRRIEALADYFKAIATLRATQGLSLER